MAQHTPGQQCNECEGFCLYTPVNVVNILAATDDHLQGLMHYGHSRDLRQAMSAVQEMQDALVKLTDAVETRRPDHESYMMLCAHEARAAIANATESAAKHTQGPWENRVDIDHYPAWIDENPALFAQSVRKFLADHPGDQWDCRISTFAGYIVRLTAIAKATGSQA